MQEPIEPTRRDVPEPDPLFTRQFHDTYRRCGEGHLYSCESWARRLDRFRSQVHTGERLPPSYVEKTPACPHCDHETWVQENKAAGQDYASAMRQFRHDRQQWDRLGALEAIDGFASF